MGLRLAEERYHLGRWLEGKASQGAVCSGTGGHTLQDTLESPLLIYFLIGHHSLLNTGKSPFLLNIYSDLVPDFDELHPCLCSCPCGSSSLTQVSATSGTLCDLGLSGPGGRLGGFVFSDSPADARMHYKFKKDGRAHGTHRGISTTLWSAPLVQQFSML